ncbi:MAG: efflux RND transporter periplasmic adaptor subunit [Flavobacteriales bacterium]|nr:efflux RND transporter periplasmic adaptor subunit [Flavobacteriales bacterium]
MPKPDPSAARTDRRRRPRRRGWAGGLLLLAAVAAGLWYLLTPRQASAPPPTAVVTRGDLEQAITALGTLQPKDYVDVGVQVSGQLKVIHVDYGSEVKAGDLLAEIDPKVFQARVDSDEAQLRILEAQLAKSQAQLELARQQDARNERLWKSKAVSEDTLQSGRAALAVAEAELRALEAQLEQARSTLEADRANLEYTKIHAPMDGTVVDITARQGQTLNANQSAPIVLRVADLDTMTVWAEVVEADVVRIQPGMPVHFSTLGLPDRRWEGKVRQILPTPEVVNDVVLYKVLIDVANPDHLLMTNMSAQVFFVLARAPDVLLVPLAALEPAGEVEAEGRPYLVKVLTPAGVEERRIHVGLTDRTRAEVLQGLSEGERVLLPVAATPPPSGGSGGFMRF